jgi:threonine dehydratase
MLSLTEINETANRLTNWIPASPLIHYPALDTLVGKDVKVWIKHENFSPTGSFKSRNAMAAVQGLIDTFGKECNVVAASTGNHGIALAWASALLGLRATIVISKRAGPDVKRAIEFFGATTIVAGDTYDESRTVASEVRSAAGAHLVEATNCIEVLLGAATVSLEVFDQMSGSFDLVMSVGGGSQVNGAISVRHGLGRSDCHIFGAQAAQAPAVYRSWRERRKIQVHPGETLAAGLATAMPYDMTFRNLLDGLDGFFLVDEISLANAIWAAASITGSFVCGSGAAALAALLSHADQFQGRNVVVCFSGSASKDTVVSLGRSHATKELKK